MDRYDFGRNYFISLPDLHWKITPHWFMIGKIHVLRLLWGGLLGLFLSFILADFLSRELFIEYSSWTGWREIMGSSPNTITNALKNFMGITILFKLVDDLETGSFFHPQTKSTREENERRRNTNRT